MKLNSAMKILFTLFFILSVTPSVFANRIDVVGGGGGGGGTECSTSSCDLHVDTTLNTQGICLADGTDCPATSGDSITVNSSAAANANFLDNLYVDWGLNTASTPDDITSKFNYAETLAGDPALLIDECIWAKDTSGGFILCEGSTADTAEQAYRLPDLNGSDTTEYFLVTAVSGSVGDGQIADSAVDGGTGGEIEDGTITAADLGTDSVSADELNATGVEAELESALDIGGEVTSTGMASTVIADSITVTGWVLGTSSATQLTSPTLLTDLIDGVGAVDMDYGSADITDHTFVSDGGTVILDGTISANGALIEDPDAEDLVIRTNAVENQMVLGSDGFVGMGIDPISNLDIYQNLPTANQILLRVRTSDDTNRASIDEDGDLSVDGGVIAGTTVTSPIIRTNNADPSDSGIFRLGNAELITWEASPASTDISLSVNSSEQFVFSDAILSPTLITPVLGTPSSGTLTNATGLPVAGTLLTAGRSLTISTNDVLADVELYTDLKTIWFENPTAADDFKTLWVAPSAVTITKIHCESDQTVNFDLQVDDGTATGVNGSDIACTTFATDSSLAGDTTMAAGDRLDLALTSVSGTPTWVSISFEFTYDD